MHVTHRDTERKFSSIAVLSVLSFFQSLSEVAGIQKVVTRGAKIYMSVSSESEQEALRHVRAMCDMWHTSYRM